MHSSCATTTNAARPTFGAVILMYQTIIIFEMFNVSCPVAATRSAKGEAARSRVLCLRAGRRAGTPAMVNLRGNRTYQLSVARIRSGREVRAVSRTRGRPAPPNIVRVSVGPCRHVSSLSISVVGAQCVGRSRDWERSELRSFRCHRGHRVCASMGGVAERVSIPRRDARRAEYTASMNVEARGWGGGARV